MSEYDRDYEESDMGYKTYNHTKVHIKDMFILPKLERKMQRRRRSMLTEGQSIGYLERTMQEGGVVTPGSLANNAPGIFRVGRHTHGDVNIPGGWGLEKGVFNLTVEEETAQYIRTCYYVGYTDGYDTSFSGLFDDDIIFYINKVYVINQLKSEYNKGIRPSPPMIFNVVDGRFVEEEEDLYIARTEDLVATSLGAEIGNGVRVNNTSNVITSRAVARDGRESVGNRGLAKLITGMMQCKYANDASNYTDATNTLDNLHGRVTNTSLGILDFVLKLGGRDKGSGLATSFTLKEIDMIFDNPDFTIQVEKDVGSVIEGDFNRDVADIDDSDPYATIANEILYNITSLGAEFLLVGCQFELDNLDGYVNARVMDAHSIIPGIDSIVLGENMLDTFIAEIYPIISERGMRTIRIYVDFTAGHGGSKVMIALDGSERLVPFYLPTYMDALLSPDIHDKRSYKVEEASYGVLQEKILGVGIWEE